MNPTSWSLMGVLFLLVAICVGISMTRSREQPTEGFAVTGSLQQYDEISKQANEDVQLGGANVVLTTGGLKMNTNLLNKALAQPQIHLKTAPARDYSSLFKEDPTEFYTRKDNEACRKATHPSQLPASTAKYRCGWWYVVDLDTPSVAAFGTYKGPMFPDTVPNRGIWMWDLIEAGKREDLKRCKRLPSCDLVDAFNTTPGVRCGFCVSLGHGVPVDGAGRILYPDDSGGCDAPLVTFSQCPKPDYKGSGGGGGGGGEDDPNICNLNANGFLSSACAVKIAKAVGMSIRGGFIQSQSGIDVPEVPGAYAVLGNVIPSMSWWTNVLTMMLYLATVVQLQVTGMTPEIRNAAITLAQGAPVDPCPADAKSTGPFSLACMQQLFRQKGCQPAGTRYPTQTDAVNNALKPWDDIDAEYTGIQVGMKSTNIKAQDKAVKECLGVTVSRNTTPCKVPGLPAGGNDPALENFANPTDDDYVFSLQLVNNGYQTRKIIVPTGGDIVRADNYPSSQAAALQWKPGTPPDTIRISPKGIPSVVFRHRGFELHADNFVQGDALLDADSTFFVRPGNSDSSQVSFESVNYPGRFLRHSGFRLYLNPWENSEIYKLDSTFQVLDSKGIKRGRRFFKDRTKMGWRVLTGSLSSVAIGSDGVIMGANVNGDAWNKGSIDGPWGSLSMSGLKYVDCANYGQVVATAFDGSVYRFRNNTWTRLPLAVVGARVGAGGAYSCVYATVNASGRIGAVVSNGSYNWLYFTDENEGGYMNQAGPGDWITYGVNGAWATLVKSTSQVTMWTSRGGTRTLEPPLKVMFAKVFLSKSSDDLLAISTDLRLFGLDIHKKWSEIPNPQKVAYAGLNEDRIIGVATPDVLITNIWTKQIRDNQVKRDFIEVENAVVGGTKTVAYSGKGLEQLKGECREMQDCIGFNYSTKTKTGTFVIGRDTGTFPAGAMDGEWLGKSLPIERAVPLATGETIYIVQDGTHTKMASSSGVAKYYAGNQAVFDPSAWSTYANAQGRYIAMLPSDNTFYRKTTARETTAREAVGVIEGDWMGGPVAITRTASLSSGETVYMTFDQPYTKMVSSSGAGRYYAGPVSSFDPSKWGTYSDATGHYRVNLK